MNNSPLPLSCLFTDKQKGVMEMGDMGTVVIYEGTYEHQSEHGTAVVHVPHDVTVGDIVPAFARFVRACQADEDEKGSKDAA